MELITSIYKLCVKESLHVLIKWVLSFEIPPTAGEKEKQQAEGHEAKHMQQEASVTLPVGV
jgi:hypothetical protein